MSRIGSLLINTAPTTMVRFPLLPLLTKNTLLLTFPGRRPGKRCTTPVGPGPPVRHHPSRTGS
jgi:hypothetical protein